MYGYKWFESEQKYVIGSQEEGDTDDLFVPQVSEMQPRGHWTRGQEREFRERGMYTWEPGPIERLKRWLNGWKWHRYSTEPKKLPNLGNA